MTSVDLEIRKAPLPDDLAPDDAEARRQWQQRLAETQVLHEGRLAHEAVLVLADGSQLLVPLAGLLESGRSNHAAALLFQLLTRPDAVAAIRRGEALLLGPGGAPTRVACLLELTSGEDGEVHAWCALRAVGEGEGGTGALLDSWHTEAGPLAHLHPALEDWVDAKGASLDITEGQTVVQTATPEIEMELIFRNDGEPAPTTPAGFADEVGMLTDAAIVREGMPWLRVFAFRGDCVEDWRVRGELPCSLDDLVRNVAAWSSPDAIALLAPGVVTCPDGVNRRGAFTLVEHHGQRYERVLPIHFAPDGTRSAPHALCRERDPVEGPDGWLGVAPSHDLGLHLKSAAAATRPVAES